MTLEIYLGPRTRRAFSHEKKPYLRQVEDVPWRECLSPFGPHHPSCGNPERVRPLPHSLFKIRNTLAV